MENRPKGRQKNATGQGKSVARRGDKLGTGPVGSQNGYSGRPQNNNNRQIFETNETFGNSHRQKQASGGRSSLIIKILIAVVLLGGGGSFFGSFFGGGNTPSQINNPPPSSYVQPPLQQSVTPQQSYGSSSLGNLLSSFTGASVSNGWTREANTGSLDTTVDSTARSKRTQILGGGRDNVTIMVYMCGTDLESRSGMATSDLQEMVSATLGSNVNLLVYTGGASTWKNNVVSNSVNQIYKVERGGLLCLENNMGSVAMTDPSTLTTFIKYCTQHYPANRNELIFWDHGGGSITGYGYDEKFSRSGAMSLKGINQALKDSGTTFDFIGFDACLMATIENALMLSPYADYLIASEETEPGIGWYYTNWLTKLSANTSMSTLDIGKTIVDDFISTCAGKCAGQKTTLSVVDLAELESTLPSELTKFASSTLDLLQNNSYQIVSDARSGAREFASSNKIDQIDIVSLSTKLGTPEGKALSDAIIGAVKYNRTSSNMTDAYGLSIYFPYRKLSTVNNAVSAYEAIDMDDEYTKCIRKFASLEVGGQAVSGGASSPISSLFGTTSGGSYTASTDIISQILSELIGGGTGSVSGLTGSNSGFLGRGIDLENDTQYLAENQFDASRLIWSTSSYGTSSMYLPEEQWHLVKDLELNVFLNDGEGFIDLGLDNVFEFTSDGGLIGEYDGTWLAIDEQPVAYYYIDSVYEGDNYSIIGRIPALLNGDRVNLIVVFDNDNPYGCIVGAELVYNESETETVAKSLLELQDGDVIDFLCDYYSYDGTYEDSYYLGEQYIVNGTPQISNVYIDADAVSATYRFTDIYQQQYWTPVMQ